jgi:glycosyltransferase involved in cell wall biosynthesis
MEKRVADLDSRLKFYYGKELYEAGKYDKAFEVLLNASGLPDLGLDDRILALQYCCYSIMGVASKFLPQHREESYARARQLAFQGLQLSPKRAEFFNIIAESYLYENKFSEALPYLNAQEKCDFLAPGGKYSGAIFSFSPLYQEIPKIQKAKAYLNLGMVEEAREEAQTALDKFKSVEAKSFLDELDKLIPLMTLSGDKTKTQDIVFTCPPVQAYPFDEEIYKTKGLGGSETALIQVAKWLKILTGRSVKVFNMRQDTLISDSGVEYIPNSKLNEYFMKYEPSVHIAWRHNTKMTEAQTYLWAHDLITPSVELIQNFDYMLCLSPFHREYTHAMCGVPYEKIITTRNGLDPKKFDFQRKPKNPNKVVWMSSPDRGLERCMLVLDKVRDEFPEIELHVYYGLDNLYKYGLSELADKLKRMMKERPWVKYHGFTEQSKMYHDVSDATIWLHPCDFIETYCITAIEMLSLGVYPITRRLGGLQDTLKDAEKRGMAVMLDHDCILPDEFDAYAEATKKALREKAWERVQFDPKTVSWEGVARDWINFMEIESPKTLAPMKDLREATI